MQAKAVELGLNWSEIIAKAEELRNKDPSEVIPRAGLLAGTELGGWAPSSSTTACKALSELNTSLG